jgi:hypothetical protein
VATEIQTDGGAAPPGEQVHLPGPSYLPVWLAFALTLAITGIVITPILTAFGAVIAIWVISRWIRETREDISELPLEH